MSNIEFVRVLEDGLYDFKGLILPNVYEELTVLGDFKTANIIAVGAVEHVDAGDVPVGLAVAGLRKDRELFIHSMIVSGDYQRRGVGTGLLESLIGLAAGNLPEILEGENGAADIFIHVDFALPPVARRAFEAFLKVNGFTDFEEGPVICLIDLDRLETVRSCAVSTPLSETADVEDLSALFGTMGLAYDPDCSVYLGSAEKPKLIILAEVINDGNLALTSRAFGPLSKEEFAGAVNDVVSAIRAKYGEPVLSVNTQFNENPEFWRTLAENAGETFDRVEAGMYAVLS